MNQPSINPAAGMRLRVIKSSLIYAVGYDEASETLVLISNQGKIYQYFGVPRNVYEDLVTIEPTNSSTNLSTNLSTDLSTDSIDRYLQDSIVSSYSYIQVKRRGRKRHR